MYFVYILQSQVDRSLYIGQTGNLDERLIRHNGKRERSTKGHAPYLILYTEQFEKRSDAIRRENQLKSYKGGEALKKLINLE